MNTKIGSIAALMFILCGCAATPTGPDFTNAVLPQPGDQESAVVVFRDYAEPTALAAKIDVDGKQIFELSQKSFALMTREPGTYSIALRWPAASGMPSFQIDAEWQGGRTYYYLVNGTTGNGWHSQSQLKLLDESLAKTMLRGCCRLMTAQKGLPSPVVNPTTPPAVDSKRSLSDAEKANFFTRVIGGMSSEDVLRVIGSPDEVSSKSTGKKGTLFYFGSDTRRESWSYTGIGFVVFTRNEYTASLKVVETKYDSAAP
jgi:hypothetical protein